MKKIFCLLGVVIYLSSFPTLAFSKDIYVDPDYRGSSDGSEKAPWKDLQKLVNSGKLKGGNRVLLKPGEYEGLVISNKKFEKPVLIESHEIYQSLLPFVKFDNSSGWVLSGHKVQSRPSKSISGGHLIDIDSKSRNIEISHNKIQSFEDEDVWKNLVKLPTLYSGVLGHGNNLNISNNFISNVNSGISVTGNGAVVFRNVIEHFAGDGIRGLGNDSIYTFNEIKNCHVINDNHDDGFQSWSVGKNGRPGSGSVKNVVLANNIFIANETRQNFPRCDMQGIGMFDGMFEDWIIENNIVIVDHWHGISVYGAKNVKILNNTVFDPERQKPGPAWIKISNHKNGQKSKNNLVANNLANSFQVDSGGALKLQNQTIRNPYALFVDPDNHDYRLKEGARAIDAGMDGVGPKVDFYGNPRPSGDKTDVGAAEYQQ